MCISDERSLLQENKYFITIIWTQSCLLLSDDVCMKEIATTNQNSIGDRTEKRLWEKPGSVGGPVPLWPDKPVFFSNCSKVRVYGLHWFQWYFPDGCLGDEVLTGDLSLGLI